MYRRPVFRTIFQRLREKRQFIQVLAGPRQSGKTTLALQLIEAIDYPSHYATADEPVLKDRFWIEQQWEAARLRTRGGPGLLILDEIQKIPGWSEVVKWLWDEDTRNGRSLHVVLLGSSPLLMQRGLAESLAGRFEIIPITHWSFPEMREAFGWSWEQYVYFGGYPGAANLIPDENRWRNYLHDSLIETTISRDILLMKRVDKPALLRRLFELGCRYSGQILSYQKMLGQLQEAGNTTTLAHYLQLLGNAGLLTGLSKYSVKTHRQRASSPKLLVLNTALMSVFSGLTFQEARLDTEYWGRLVETAVGAHLYNRIMGKNMELFYWQEGNREVDFVLVKGEHLLALEVKSGRRKDRLPGLEAFARKFPVEKKLLVGADGILLEEFLCFEPEAPFN